MSRAVDVNAAADAPAVDADVVVAGAGPAGLALAGALAARGVDVVCVDPNPAHAWRAGYGLWLDEAEALGISDSLSATWRRTIVRTAHGAHTHDLQRAYARIDNAKLASHVRGSARVVAGRVDVNAPGKRIIDCTGAVPSDAAQTAYGVVIDGDVRALVPADTAVLMDFDARASAPSSFLYAFALPDGRTFVEETSLASSPPVPLALLRDRLRARLLPYDAWPGDVDSASMPFDAIERCHIPLPRTVPERAHIARFGAAAGLVHPTTGYSLATTLRQTPVVADAIADVVRTGASAAELARVAYAALWTPARKRARALQLLGLDLLLRLDAEGTDAFFDAVFGAGDGWRVFMDGDADPDALLAQMGALFSALPKAVRRALLQIVVLRHPRHVPDLVRAALG